MDEFVVDEEGYLHAKRIRDTAQWHAANTPVKDVLVWEANGLAIRVGHAVLEAGRPQNSTLSVGQYRVLRRLSEAHRHRLTLSEVSREIGLTLTGVSRIVGSLVATGHVTRIDDGDDRRRVWVQLTPSGREYIAAMVPQVSERVERTWSSLTPKEKRVLSHLLAKVKLQLHVSAKDDRLLENEEFD
jgi:DNA-binding MarR family transcriptional regulator